MRLSLISWNVNGLRAVYKRGQLDPVFDIEPDILCLQETKAAIDQLPEELTSRGGYSCFFASAERRGYSGVALYTKLEPESVRCSLEEPEFDREGRLIIADYGRFHLCNVYFPNGGASPERLRYKLDFYRAFLSYLDALVAKGNRVVVCGDVNTAHREIDLARPKENQRVSGFLPEEREWIDELISHGFIDTFRLFDSSPGKYTWWDNKTRSRERNVGWRIDAFYVSENLRDNLVSASIFPDVLGSDHCPIGLELEF